jgi:hypothetical protein
MSRLTLIYIVLSVFSLCTAWICIAKGVPMGYIWGATNIICVLYCWNQVLEIKYFEKTEMKIKTFSKDGLDNPE